ncbi:hypothetical protein D9M69_552140 [compost metagenome]
MHAVCEQHEAVADLQLALQVVHHEVVFDAHGAQQLVFEVGVVDDVVVRELQRFVFAQQVAARIAHMGQGVRLAAQHERGERGQAHGGLAAVVGAGEPGVLRADDAVERDGGVPGFGRVVVTAHQAGDGGLRRLAAHAASAHAVGDGDDGAHVFLPRGRQHGGAEVFVLVLAAGLADETDIYMKGHASTHEHLHAAFVLGRQLLEVVEQAFAGAGQAFQAQQAVAPGGAAHVVGAGHHL